MLQLPPLSLYVHIPWCVRKCPYCDFNSHQAGDHIPEQAYVRKLIADLRADQHWGQGRKLHSIFFGGGTHLVEARYRVWDLFVQCADIGNCIIHEVFPIHVHSPWFQRLF